MATPEFEVTRLDSSVPYRRFEQIAEIHTARIPEGFLSSLGRPFLARLYRTLASSRYAFLIAACQQERVIGFICCSTDTRRAYMEFLLRSWISTGRYLLPRLISLGTIKKVVETALYPAQKAQQALPRAEILNFCVSEEAAGQGVGAALFDEMVGVFREREVEQIKIVSGEQQAGAHRFYEKRGARRALSFQLHQGHESVVYLLETRAYQTSASIQTKETRDVV